MNYASEWNWPRETIWVSNDLLVVIYKESDSYHLEWRGKDVISGSYARVTNYYHAEFML